MSTVVTMELDELRRLVQEGVESGPGIDAEHVFSRLRGKYAAIPSKEVGTRIEEQLTYAKS